jgi:hypothetical protein
VTGGEVASQAVDPVEFRDGQRAQWNTAATGWRKHSELIDAAASGVSDRLVEMADVKPGDRVLFGKYSGSEVKIDDEEYLIMREDEILGVFTTIAKALSAGK